jgi:Fe2+ transport system protein B
MRNARRTGTSHRTWDSGQPTTEHPVLKTLDRYIIRQFLGTFFFILVVIMLIAVVFDISEKTRGVRQDERPRTGDRLRLLLSTS